MRDRYGQKPIEVLSKLSPDGEGLEEDMQVFWSRRSDPPFATTSLATRLAFSMLALRFAFHDQPEIVLTGRVNLGPLGRIVASLVRGLLVQNIYGTELWTVLSIIRKKALTSGDAVIFDWHNTADFAEKIGFRKEAPDVV